MIDAPHPEQRPAQQAASGRPAPDAEMKAIVRRIEHTRLADLPVDLLDELDADLARRQAELLTGARAVAAELETQLAAGNGLGLAELRKEAGYLGRQHDRLAEEREQVGEARQTRVLNDRLINVLGGPHWLQLLELFILGLIVLVVSLLTYEFTHPDLSLEARRWFLIVDTACCFVFLGDFFFRYRYADSKRWFVRRYWLDFITSIPLPDFQLLRIGRVARVARAARLARMARFVRLVRGVRLVLFFWRGMDQLGDVLNVRLMKRSLVLGLTILLLGALTIYRVEGHNAPVSTFGDSVWWSFTTLVTGGFGDIHNPGSLIGRGLTVLLILAGMTVVGVFIATLTSVLVGDETEHLQRLQRQLETRLDNLAEQVEEITRDQR